MRLRFILRIFTAGLFLAAALHSTTYGQADDISSARSADSTDNSQSPRGALWRAAVLPGWGQFYNEQYLKIPVVYGTLGGVTTLAVTFNRQYLKYRRAYLFQAYQALVEQGEIDEHPYPQYQDEHARLINRTGPLSSEILRRQRDKLRRNRDLMYIGLGVAYALSIVDAYVSAHLADFDVGSDLSLQVAPVGRYLRLRLILN